MESSVRTGFAESGAEKTLELELEVVASAVALVAAGGSPRVTLAGLRFGPQLLAGARYLGVASGVRVAALWRLDDSGCDFVLEGSP